MNARRLFPVVLAAILAIAGLVASADGLGDLAFHRVALRPDRLAVELERARLGVWRQLPLDQFDDLARRAATPPAERPRLVETRYRARLDDESLMGSAAWTVRQASGNSALLSIDPLQVALRRVTWDGGRPAVFGNLDTRPQSAGLELLVDRSGEQVLALDWSARGVPEPTGLRFDLRLPACAVAVLELELPADIEPFAARDGAVLTGSWPAEGGLRLWRVAFGPSTQLDLTLRRRVPVADTAPLVFARQRNTHELTFGAATCEYVIDYEVARGAITELALECDPGFRPTEVAARNLRGWTALAGKAVGASRVVATLAEPTQGGVLTLRGSCDLSTDSPWHSPSIRPVGAVPRGETLTLRVHPDLRLADWSSGGFRVADVALSTDGWHTIQVHSLTGRDDGVRPSARVIVGGPDYTVRQRLWWHVASEQATLTAELALTVARGTVERVPLELPTGWTVQRVESRPPNVGPAYEVSPDHRTLTLTWPRPLAAGDVPTASVVLARPTPKGDMPFPDLVPWAARGRDGVLVVRVEPGLESSTRGPTALATDAAEELAKVAPWGGALQPTAAYALPRSAVEGVLRVAPVRPDYATSMITRVVAAGRSVRVEHELHVEPTGGAPDAVVLYLPTAGHEPWDWQVARGRNRVRSAVRWPSGPPLACWLAATSTWEAVAIAGVRDPAVWWRVAFERPLTEAVDLRASVELALPSEPADAVAAAIAPLGAARELEVLATAGTAPACGTSWAVPLVRTPTAQRESHEIEVILRTPGWGVRTSGATELAIPESSPGRHRYRAENGAARITLMRVAATDGTIDGTRIESSLREGGCDHELTFRLWDWPTAEVAVELLNGVIVHTASVDGHTTRAEMSDGSRWRIPVPFGRRVSTVTVRFSAVVDPWLFWTRLASPAVKLPGVADPVTVVWKLPDGIKELWPGSPTPTSSIVVRPLCWSLAGYAVAVAAVFAFSCTKRRWPMAVALAAAAAATVVAPPALTGAARWPLFALALAAVVAMVPRRVVAQAPLAVAALAAWLGIPGQAAAPIVPTVYLVPGDGGAEPRTVLAPPDLLDRMAARVRAVLPPDFIVPVEASYDGRIEGISAHVQATVVVEASADGSLTLPFAGALLRGAKLDGVAAFPQATGDRLIVPAIARGRHRLELEFVVSCPEGEERELRFAVVESPVCSFGLRLPNSARFVQTQGRRGAQRLNDVAGGRRLEIDLGRIGFAAVRWRQDVSHPTQATVAVREAYLWDLQPTRAKLTGALRYAVTGGVASLGIDIPHELEVTSASARPLDPPGAAGAAPWLRAWRVTRTDGGRRLILDFSAPVTGNWVVILELAPTQPFGASFALNVPRAAGARVAAPTVLAWRAAEFTPLATRVQGWTAISADDFLRYAWLPARAEPDPRPPARAFRQTLPGMPAILRLAVPSIDPPAAEIEASWRVAPRRADAKWSVRLTGTGKVGLVECDLPVAVELADVAGPDVFAWTRSGTRVQAWLRRMVDSTEITLTGSLPRRAETARFEVASLRPVGATVTGTLRVAADDGLALTPVMAQQLEAVPNTGRGGHVWEYHFRQATARAAFQVRLAAGATDFRVDSSVAWREGRPEVTASVSARIRRGELRYFTVTAASADGWEVAVNAPGAVQVREATAPERHRAWIIDLPPGVSREYSVTWTARGPNAGEWAVPIVSVRVPDERTNRVDRSVALVGPGWHVVATDYLVSKPPGAWQPTRDDARLVVARAAVGVAEGRVVIGSEEIALARTAGGRWLARGRYRLRDSGSGKLRLTWPEPVRLIAAVRDGLSLPLPTGATRDYTVKLPNRRGDGFLALTWEAAPAGSWPDSLAGPLLAADGAVLVGHRTAVIVPPPGTLVGTRAEPFGSPGATSEAQSAPFDGLFDDATNAVRFHPPEAWPLALAWSTPPERWPLVLAKLLGVALLLGLGCVIAWRATGPIWPFGFILLGAGLAIVDRPWAGLFPAAIGIAGGAALALADRTRPLPPDDAAEDEVGIEGA